MTPSKRQPRKPTGEIGSTFLSTDGKGIVSAKIIPSNLPDGKEELERRFFDAFVEAFNRQLPLGPESGITDAHQNDTSDLDFEIECRAAKYAELAELNPTSETFGRTLLRTGKYKTYEYAKWIYFRIVSRKQKSYGDLAEKVILILYVTHWQFNPDSGATLSCLRAHCSKYGCSFAGVFVLYADSTDLRVIETIWPYEGPPLGEPKNYSLGGVNLPPGTNQWTINVSDADDVSE